MYPRRLIKYCTLDFLTVKLLKKGTSDRFVRILQNWYSKLCAVVQ